ncbi:MAG: PepSY-associated TM helix domain-containing protein, partial [Hyphomicrobiaceae bacterium]|nr:PepSY-associated TM helix domain-containing protein [Hyphomicrobiaceae bacterium]
ELLAGETGHLLVALSALGGLILTASGLYLWWPRPGRWRQTLALRAGAFGRARWLDYHNVPTVWLFVPYLVVLVTGLYLQRSDWIDPLVEPLSEIRELDNSASASSPPGACAAATGIDEAIALARTGRDPAEVIKAIWRPSGPQTPYFIELNAPGRNPRAGASVIWVDRNCPRVISVRDLSTLTTAETVKSWLWPVHTDLGLGLVGQGLVFLTGLLMTALFATGAVLWWQRR